MNQLRLRRNHQYFHRYFIFFISTSLLLLAISCEDNESITSQENSTNLELGITKSLLIEEMQELRAIANDEQKIVVLNIKDLGVTDKNEKYKFLDLSPKEFSFYTGVSTKNLGPDDDYKVTCVYGDGETEVTECGNDVACAGNATWDCLEGGGCAEVCNAKVVFIPSNYKTKINKLSKLEAVLYNVEEISKSQNGTALEVVISYNNDDFWISKPKPISLNTGATRDWTVDCFDSDGNLMWSETFDDRGDASVAILNCTDVDGGCAQVCQVEMRYSGSR